MINKKIAFLGAGNMGEAIISGIIAGGCVSPRNIVAADVRPARLKYLKKKFNIRTTEDNSLAVRQCGIVFICVKPQSMGELLGEISGSVKPAQLVVSIAAGITTRFIEKYFANAVPIVRVMPNLPLLAGQGATGLSGGRYAKKPHLAAVNKLFSACGIVEEVGENKLNAVTALSGSGPAYVFYLAEMLKDAGKAMGLEEGAADRLSRQTVFGAGKMLKEQKLSASRMRRNVTSPGGTTEAALRHLEKKKFSKIFIAAVRTAQKRASELSK